VNISTSIGLEYGGLKYIYKIVFGIKKCMVMNTGKYPYTFQENQRASQSRYMCVIFNFLKLVALRH